MFCCPSGEVYSQQRPPRGVPLPDSCDYHTHALDVAKGNIRVSVSFPLIPGIDARYTLGDMTRQMFVSAWSLGSAGMWIDRQKGSINQRIVEFTANPSQLCTKESSSVPGEDSVPGGDVLDEVPTRSYMSSRRMISRYVCCSYAYGWSLYVYCFVQRWHHDMRGV